MYRTIRYNTTQEETKRTRRCGCNVVERSWEKLQDLLGTTTKTNIAPTCCETDTIRSAKQQDSFDGNPKRTGVLQRTLVNNGSVLNCKWGRQLLLDFSVVEKMRNEFRGAMRFSAGFLGSGLLDFKEAGEVRCAAGCCQPAL
jgi:hypothetical protein